ncbi:hypothetical protein FNV43_RR10034 [Rhamnella rubrinervis]|uniref:Serine aminopeptidase S33 domain-containing protein n=1 Tax=Rhamnella rubrinervis TaxID=2594499 RepID=A0A8K0HBI0_9ROSA|nr:hypothetical protein FNV43_RR10034 [Rhamnella rubrinervis]
MGCMFSHLAARFAFFPPSPATYEIKKREDGKLTVVSSSTSTMASMPIPHPDDSSLDVLLIDTKRGNKIVAFYLRNPYARLTLLYSHGNAADLGQLYDLFVQLKVNLRVNLMGYDYSGYGASTGEPSESNTYADIEAVYECLETEYGVSQENLILYGQSVGSGPTLHLAAKLPRLRGVVLHSAILSGLRVLCHVKFTFCFDIYKNVNKIEKVKCPVLVIHGTEDDVVNWLHGNVLWKMARDPYEPLWIKGGGHCNLELYPDYIRHLCRFVQEMESITTEIRLKKIRQNLRLQKRSDSTSIIASCSVGDRNGRNFRDPAAAQIVFNGNAQNFRDPAAAQIVSNGNAQNFQDPAAAQIVSNGNAQNFQDPAVAQIVSNGNVAPENITVEEGSMGNRLVNAADNVVCIVSNISCEAILLGSEHYSRKVQFPDQRFEGTDSTDEYAKHSKLFFDVNMSALDGIQGPMYVLQRIAYLNVGMYPLHFHFSHCALLPL